MKQWVKVHNQKGFTMLELLIIIVIMGVLTTIAFSSFRMSREQIACKSVYYAMQSAKMRSIATGHDSYVDFDMDGGAVSKNFFAVYLDTDSNAAFGETNNSEGDNEFTESNYLMPDCIKSSGEVVRSGDSTLGACLAAAGSSVGVALPNGVAFGGKATSPGGGTMGTYGPPTNNWVIPDDGVNVTGSQFQFTSNGTANAGEVYLWDTNDSLGAGCAVIVSTTGRIKRMDWDGANWK